MLKIYINILIILVFWSCDFLSKEIPADANIEETRVTNKNPNIAHDVFLSGNEKYPFLSD